MSARHDCAAAGCHPAGEIGEFPLHRCDACGGTVPGHRLPHYHKVICPICRPLGDAARALRRIEVAERHAAIERLVADHAPGHVVGFVSALHREESP